MSDSHSALRFATNQSPPFHGFNAWNGDPLLQRIGRGLGEGVRAGLSQYGAWAGKAETLELARLANRHLPALRTHDAKGNRIDHVDFHPAWHALMRKSVAMGMHASIWDETSPEQGSRNLARALRYFIASGVECGHLCPGTGRIGDGYSDCLDQPAHGLADPGVTVGLCGGLYPLPQACHAAGYGRTIL